MLILLLVFAKPKETPRFPCDGSICGQNAMCKSNFKNGTCVCKPNYVGDPFIECRPYCSLSADCPRTFVCIDSKCVDPCENACGVRARCEVVNHNPICFCPNGLTGNPLILCNTILNCKHVSFLL